MIYLKLTDKLTTIERRINSAIVKEARVLFKQVRVPIEDRVRSAVFSHYKNTTTYQSLIGGKLTAEFGFPRGYEKKIVDSVLIAVSGSVRVEIGKVKLLGTQLQGEFSVNVLKKDLSDAFSADYASFAWTKYIIPWLDWLLRQGDKIIFGDFGFQERLGEGRSKKGIMVPRGTGWRVPPEFSGTPENNWLTRAITTDNDTFRKKISVIIEEEIRKFYGN